MWSHISLIYIKIVSCPIRRPWQEGQQRWALVFMMRLMHLLQNWAWTHGQIKVFIRRTKHTPHIGSPTSPVSSSISGSNVILSWKLKFSSSKTLASTLSSPWTGFHTSDYQLTEALSLSISLSLSLFQSLSLSSLVISCSIRDMSALMYWAIS